MRMSRLIRVVLFQLFLLPLFYLNGQNAILNKTVTLQVGQSSLKTVLNSMSTQTGCVFSYDPTKISDKQIITHTGKSSMTLNAALLEILPKNTQFLVNGKYIVLKLTEVKKTPEKKLKSATLKEISTISKKPEFERLVLPPLQNSTSNPSTQEIQITPDITSDSISIKEEIIPIKDTLIAVQKDSIIPEKSIQISVQPKDSTKTSTSKFGDFLNRKGFLQAALSANNQLASFSVQAGLYNVYAILSFGSDYNDSYLFGYGVGINLKIDTHFSASIDLLQNSLIAGKSYLLQVRASNTQFVPVINYSIGKTFKFFAGPTINLIQSSYVSSLSTTNLGLLVGIGYSVGIKMDLKNLISGKKSKSV